MYDIYIYKPHHSLLIPTYQNKEIKSQNFRVFKWKTFDFDDEFLFFQTGQFRKQYKTL